MDIIEVRNVSKSFASSDKILKVLDEINLNVREGEFFVIVGPSGCGKTTLLKIMHGLITPDSGEVYIDGEKVKGPSSLTALVFQTSNLFPWRTVLKNVEFGLEVQKIPDNEKRTIAKKHLETVGLSGFENFYPRQLSEGMKQRAAIARALAVNPKILLMDEPFASLDAYTRELMQTELLNIWEKFKKTVVFVTHSIDEAIFMGDRIAILSYRPARVLEVLETRIQRPRSEDIKSSSEFLELRKHIWSMLKH